MKLKASVTSKFRPSIVNRLNLWLSATFIITLIFSLIGLFIKVSPQINQQVVELPVKIAPSGNYDDVVHQLQLLESKPNFVYMSKAQIIKELTQSNAAGHTNSKGLIEQVVNDRLPDSVFKRHAQLTAQAIAYRQVLPEFVNDMVHHNWRQLNGDNDMKFSQRTWMYHLIQNPAAIPVEFKRQYNYAIQKKVLKILETDFSFTHAQVKFAVHDATQFQI